MRILRILFLLASAIILAIPSRGANYLFHEGRTDFTIVLSKQASLSEQTAAKELQACILQMSGVSIPITDVPPSKGHHIYIGYQTAVSKKLGKSAPSDSDESFIYCTAGNDLFIFGGRSRGTMYGVFAFMEQQLGIRWYAPDYTKIPRRKSWLLPTLYHSERPAFRYREMCTYHGLKNRAWAAHNLLNTGGVADLNYGPWEYTWEAHAMGKFLSAEEFFGSHPQYFSLQNGRRVSNGQLCLSNKAVVRLLTERMLQTIKEHRSCWVYDLSPNDNENYCTCDNCLELVRRYGSQSGAVLWVVNQVADEVAKVYPDKMIAMFAYLSTCKPPIGIVPRPNVLIRLCSTDFCRLHPLTDAENAEFDKYYKDWRRLTPNILVWDYMINFSQYLLPFPNYDVCAYNLRYFRDQQAVGVLTMGQYESEGGEFTELRQWIQAKLLWNPDLDPQPLIHQFITDYYGKAATYVLQYYDLCQRLQTGKWHLKQSTPEVLGNYPDSFVKQGKTLLNRAKKVAGKDTLLARRIDLLRLQILMLQTQKNPARSLMDGTQKEMQKLMKREGGIYPAEHDPDGSWLRRAGYI